MRRPALAVSFVLLSASLVFSQANAPVTARGEWSADTRQWWSDDGERRIQLNLRAENGESRWGTGVRLSELEGWPAAAETGIANDVRFSWSREAGVFRFQGSFDRGRGNGTFTFSANPDYVTGMGSLGYRNLTTDDLLRLAVLDVTQIYARGLRDAGYAQLPVDDLVRMQIHRVPPKRIRDLGSLGYRNLPVEDLVRFRIHKVTPEFIKAMQSEGYKNVSPEELVRFRIHKVSPEFVRALAERNYRNIPGDDLVKMMIHRVSVQEMDELKSL